MTVEVKTYHLPPTRLIPNSPYPLVHYPGLLAHLSPTSGSTTSSVTSGTIPASEVHTLFTQNHWQTQWIFRYGPTQQAHYHSRVHECMAVLSGTARIRFGVADDEINDSASPLEIDASPGDVFIIPAGVAHKTFHTEPVGEFSLLTPGDGHRIQTRTSRAGMEDKTGHALNDESDGADDEEIQTALNAISLTGFTMIGAYPTDRDGEWDFAVGGEDISHGRREGKGGKDGYERVWSVKKPELDPVLGRDGEGVCGLWL